MASDGYEDESEDPYVAYVATVRGAFKGGGNQTRGQLLRQCRGVTVVSGMRKMIDQEAAESPHLSREEAFAPLLEAWMGHYGRVADDAGLDADERTSFLAAVRRGCLMALNGQEGEPDPERWEPDPSWTEANAAKLRQAFEERPSGRLRAWLEQNAAEITRITREARDEAYADRPDLFAIYMARMKAAYLGCIRPAGLGPADAEFYTKWLNQTFEEASRIPGPEGGE